MVTADVIEGVKWIDEFILGVIPLFTMFVVSVYDKLVNKLVLTLLLGSTDSVEFCPSITHIKYMTTNP